MSSNLPSNSQNELESRLEGLERTAETLTVNAFGKERTDERNSKLLRKLDLISENAIEAFESRLKQDAVAGKPVSLTMCRAGCYYCCHQRVSCTIPEVLAIASHIRETYTAKQMEDLMERLDSYQAGLASEDEESRTACPMLVDGLCSIHPIRPFVCRGFNSTDVDACRYFKEHRESGWRDELTLREQWLSALRVRMGIQLGLMFQEMDTDVVHFPVALKMAIEHPEIESEFFAGKEVFGEAKVKEGRGQLKEFAQRHPGKRPKPIV